MIYIKLFLAFLQIGTFSVGGGYAAIALIKEQTVEINNWLSMSEFTDIATIAEMTPGPVTVNAATFVGIKIAGFGGALAATLGSIAPGIIISCVLAFVYFKYNSSSAFSAILKSLRPATIGLILSAGISVLQYAVFTNGEIGVAGADFVLLLIFVVAFMILRKTKLPPIPIMLSSGGVYLFIMLLTRQ